MTKYSGNNRAASDSVLLAANITFRKESKMQVKFRGKRVDNGEWVYGYYVFAPQPNHSKHEHCIFDEKAYKDGESFAFCFRYVHPSSVGMWTGLKDKNGVEIYGSDVINLPDHKGEAVVEWDEFQTGWCVGSWCGSTFKNGEVIGNTTDNPELIS